MNDLTNIKMMGQKKGHELLIVFNERARAWYTLDFQSESDSGLKARILVDEAGDPVSLRIGGLLDVDKNGVPKFDKPQDMVRAFARAVDRFYALAVFLIELHSTSQEEKRPVDEECQLVVEGGEILKDMVDDCDSSFPPPAGVIETGQRIIRLVPPNMISEMVI